MTKSVCLSWASAASLAVALLLLPVAGRSQSAGDLYSTDNIVGKMRFVPAGVFTQGSPTNEPGRNPDENQFTHFLTKNIAVMETAVTKQMWADLKLVQTSLPPDPNNPSLYFAWDAPVHSMTWYLAILFANLLSVENGLTPCYYKDSRFTVMVDVTNYKSGGFFCNFEANGYRLPTEGEREYFARAGTTGVFSIDEPNYSEATCSVCSPGSLPSLESVSWFCTDGAMTVGSKGANPWNLKDVHGNVMEWCWDYYGPYPANNATDFRGAALGDLRVMRGGAWPFNARLARSAHRFSRMPHFRLDASIGLRLVRTISPVFSSNVTVTSPAGGESWWAGTARPIAWTATDDIDYVNIEYSTDNGAAWTLIASSVPNSGQWDWSVPSVNSTSCLVRISNAANPATHDICAANFSIVASPSPVLHLNRPEVDFYAASGQTSVPSQWLMIGNSGGGTLNWSANPSAGWITVTPSSGTGSQLVKIDASPAGLGAGTYVETITISDPQAAGSPQTLLTVLNISSSSVEPYFTVDLYSHGGGGLFMKFMDFDTDGDQDIIYSQCFGQAGAREPMGNGRILAFRNDGNGNFREATAEVFLGNNVVVGGANLLVADYNRDGREDLFAGDAPYDTGPYGGGDALLFIQSPDGRLKNESESRLPAGLGGNEGAAGDVDGDNDIDIYLPAVGLVINDGNGYFTLDNTGLPPVVLPVPGNSSYRFHYFSAFLDVESDGDSDLFLCTGGILPQDGRDIVLLNDGSGHFTEAPADILPPPLVRTALEDLKLCQCGF